MADQERRLKEAHVLGLPKPLPSNDRMGIVMRWKVLLEKMRPAPLILLLSLEVEAGELRAAVMR